MSLPIDRIREKISIVEEASEVEQNIDDVAGRIKRLLSHNLVPVICEDMYEYENPETGERQSFHSYLVEKVISRCKSKIEMTESELSGIVNEGYYGISLLEAKMGRALYEDLFNAAVDEDDNLYQGICLKQDVADFLKTCRFPLIVTTSCFPVIEKVLDQGYKSYWCELGRKNDSPLPSMCVYHIFGKAKPGNSNWGYNDKQILRFLRSVYSDYQLKNLKSGIENIADRQMLMILGNDTPDWLFRFILTPIYGGDVYDDGNGYYLSEDERNDSMSLDRFLCDIKFEKESQMMAVLREVTSKVMGGEQTQNPEEGSKYDFFVAHASDDKELARKLVERLRSHGLKVWVDYENIKDGKYWERIIDGIRNSSYFMPLVTGKYIMKTVSAKEQKEALGKLGITRLPLDHDKSRELNELLDGVQVELLLAECVQEMSGSDAYSIPVLAAGAEVFDEPLTASRVENWSRDSRRLPKELFWGIQMHKFDENAPEIFDEELDWGKYRSNM